ncbi:DNA-primase RepB domain-containing protein [Deinococcus sp. NW-56]|uniref:DNA-primase RepB domain-containing protein n=1 Tax=Deinococcus sp. NW-56 TaxID=2080419 RepID=UPI000CF46931|nr:DNA-primase RepB domain-containing protein [Deinococcus sp. NW-56]
MTGHVFDFDRKKADAINHEAAARLLELLCEPGERVYVQTFPDGERELYGDGKPRFMVQRRGRITHGTAVGGEFVTVGRVREGRVSWTSPNLARVGIFFTVNALTPKATRRTADNVERVRAAFVDFDGAPLPDEGFPLAPTAIVETSPGRYHVYWALSDLPLADFTPVQKYLAARYGGDPSVSDLPRVMRLPGYWHGKQEPGFLVRLLEDRPTCYTRADLLEAFDGLEDALRRAGEEEDRRREAAQDQARRAADLRAQLDSGKVGSKADAVRKYGEAALLDEVSKLAQTTQGGRNSQLFKSAATLGELAAAGALDPDAVKGELGAVALSIGLSEHETRETLEGGLRRGMKNPRDLSDVGAKIGKPQADPAEDGDDDEGGREKRPPAGTRVLEYAQEDGAELWHDQTGNAYVTVTVKGHREHYRLPSRAARDYLQALYFDREKRALNGQAQKEALDLMQAIARREGEQHHTAVRLAHLNGFTYLDLGTPTWEAVEVGPGYWKAILPHECPVRFTRPAGFLPLPAPVQGGSLEELGEFLNTDRRGLMMVTAWLLGAVSGMSPYPILALGGEQGTGKSTASSAARNLIDPNQADRRRSPKEERDLFIAAQNGHILSFDNLSSIPGWLSDALCVISTGGAFTARALYTDSEETILEAVRPVIVNGIPDLLARPDLAERALTVTLQRIPGDRRTPERVFKARYERARPRLLGALLSALAHALKHLDSTELEESPRLADFARLIVAAEDALPWDRGAFLTAYREMQTEAASTVLDGEPLAEALRCFMDDTVEWVGTVKKLLGILGEREYSETRPPQGWPRTPKALGDALRRLAPALSKTGYSVTPAGKSKDGVQYRLSKEAESKFTKFTDPLEAVSDGENPGELWEGEVHPQVHQVHPEPVGVGGGRTRGEL